jgi:small-conductance mechanosensitive channel
MLQPIVGRILSAAGAAVLILALFLVWYHVDRANGATTTSTGWETFPRLRIIILVGAVLTLATALVAQVRWVLLARTALGLVLAALIMRRIIDPPDIDDPVSAQFGVFCGFLAALAVALGGLVDTGRRVAAEGLGGLGLGPPRPQLPPGDPRTGGEGGPGGAVVKVRNHASGGR